MKNEWSRNKYVYNLNSVILRNNDNKSFTLEPLPVQAQFAPVNAILMEDFNGDRHTDILIAGSNLGFHYGQGRIDALEGLILEGDDKGSFTINQELNLKNDVKSLEIIHIAHEKFILVGNNKGPLESYLIQKDQAF